MKRVLLLCFALGILSAFTAGQVTAGVTDEAPSYSVSTDNSSDFFAIHIDAEMPDMIVFSKAVTVYGEPVEYTVALLTEKAVVINKAPPRCMNGMI